MLKELRRHERGPVIEEVFDHVIEFTHDNGKWTMPPCQD
jgi:hypothetical protein